MCLTKDARAFGRPPGAGVAACVWGRRGVARFPSLLRNPKRRRSGTRSVRLPLAVWSGLCERSGGGGTSRELQRTADTSSCGTSRKRGCAREGEPKPMCAGGQHPFPLHCQPVVAADVHLGRGKEEGTVQQMGGRHPRANGESGMPLGTCVPVCLSQSQRLRLTT